MNVIIKHRCRLFWILLILMARGLIASNSSNESSFDSYEFELSSQDTTSCDLNRMINPVTASNSAENLIDLNSEHNTLLLYEEKNEWNHLRYLINQGYSIRDHCNPIEDRLLFRVLKKQNFELANLIIKDKIKDIPSYLLTYFIRDKNINIVRFLFKASHSTVYGERHFNKLCLQFILESTPEDEWLIWIDFWIKEVFNCQDFTKIDNHGKSIFVDFVNNQQFKFADYLIYKKLINVEQQWKDAFNYKNLELIKYLLKTKQHDVFLHHMRLTKHLKLPPISPFSYARQLADPSIITLFFQHDKNLSQIYTITGDRISKLSRFKNHAIGFFTN